MEDSKRRIEVLSAHLVAGSAPVVAAAEKKNKGSVDFLNINDLLSVEERKSREEARVFAEEHMKPIVNDCYEKAEFPMHLIEKMKTLKIAGGNIKGHGCPAKTALALGVATMEMSKVSSDIATFLSILQTISMLPIAHCGSEAQKTRFLPKMAALEAIGAFGLTEPLAGSDAAGLLCEARPTAAGWKLTGEKRWIGNAPFADVIIIWARNTETKQINGFIVERGTPGLSVETIDHKVAFRIVQNGHIKLDGCIVSEDNRLPLATDFNSGPGKSLFLTRILASWTAVGIAAGSYEACLAYVQSRKQFGKPLAKNQLVQERLVKMLGNLQAMVLIGREVVSLARELVGGNGIVTSFGVARAFVDMEAVHTFEGTYDINVLIAAREITGLSSFR
eukprot:gene3491-3987_t